MRKISGTAEVSMEYTQWHGGRATHVGVTLAFDASKPSGFSSIVTWPQDASYERAIKDAVMETLYAHFGNATGVNVVLNRIVWDEIHNSENGFRRSATAATKAALSVLETNAL
jgi:hypothetical protein